MALINCRNYYIDFLRGIAILLVLVLHFNLSYHLDQSALNKIFSTGFIDAVAYNGNYGVTMFFVISGFLITSTSLERYDELGRVDVMGFYIFRFARIMPCLLLALGMIVILNLFPLPIFHNNPDSTSFSLAIFSVLTFWHNILMEKAGYFNYCLNIYWSLSVEEVFYLAFPIACIFFKKMRFIIPFWLALMIIGPIYRHFYSTNEIVALYGYLSCFDAIAIGCCAALIAKRVRFKDWFQNVIRWAAGSMIVIVYLYSEIMDNVVFGVSLVALGTAVLLISAKNETLQQNSQANFFGKMVAWFGKNSYELYLFHIIILAIMKEIISRESLGDYSKLLWMTLFFLLSAALSGLLARFYSKPANKFLRELFLGLCQRKQLTGSQAVI